MPMHSYSSGGYGHGSSYSMPMHSYSGHGSSYSMPLSYNIKGKNLNE